MGPETTPFMQQEEMRCPRLGGTSHTSAEASRDRNDLIPPHPLGIAGRKEE